MRDNRVGVGVWGEVDVKHWDADNIHILSGEHFAPFDPRDVAVLDLSSVWDHCWEILF
jgi:hypothetical protein